MDLVKMVLWMEGFLSYGWYFSSYRWCFSVLSDGVSCPFRWCYPGLGGQSVGRPAVGHKPHQGRVSCFQHPSYRTIQLVFSKPFFQFSSASSSRGEKNFKKRRRQIMLDRQVFKPRGKISVKEHPDTTRALPGGCTGGSYHFFLDTFMS